VELLKPLGISMVLTIHYQSIFKPLLTKYLKVVLAVAGGLAVGKEGPLAHIGANIGVAFVYLSGFAFC
jgi:H+/Cl- antiporter ClcA